MTAPSATRVSTADRVAGAAVATARAEAALLGTCLLDPTVIDRYSWLHGHDFTDPWHRQVWHTLTRHHTPDRASRDPDTRGGPPRLDLRDLARATTSTGPRRVQAPRMLHDLIAATPQPPRPDAYARIILAASTRRAVTLMAPLLHAAGLSAALRGSAHPAVCTTATITELAGDLDARHTAALTSTRPGAPRSPYADPDLLVRLATQADRAIDRATPPDPQVVAGHERDLVVALLAQPAAIGPVAATPRPGSLTTPVWLAAYDTLLDLHERGDTVDEVTVLAALAARAPGLTPAWAEQITTATAQNGYVDPTHAAAMVARHRVARVGADAAAALRQAAAHPGLAIADLLSTATTLAGALTAAVSGLPSHPDGGPTARPSLRVITHEPHRATAPSLPSPPPPGAA